MVWILGGFALIAFLDLAPLLRRHNKRAVAAFLFLFCIALSLAILQALGVKVPSTMMTLDALCKSVGLAYTMN